MELRTRPVTGTLRTFKRLFYKAVPSSFSRQFNRNSATVDLIEAVYRELQRKCEAAYAGERFARSNYFIIDAGKKAIDFSTGDVLASCGQSPDQEIRRS